MVQRRTVRIKTKDRGSLTADMYESVGPWAVTHFYGSLSGFNNDLYTVTHIPSGGTVIGWGVSRRVAKRVLRALAKLPNQTAWRRIRYKKHLTGHMRTLGRETVMKAMGF